MLSLRITCCRDCLDLTIDEGGKAPNDHEEGQMEKTPTLEESKLKTTLACNSSTLSGIFNFGRCSSTRG